MTKNRAIGKLFKARGRESSPYELGKEFFERNARTKPSHETARHSKRLLRELFRSS